MRVLTRVLINEYLAVPSQTVAPFQYPALRCVCARGGGMGKAEGKRLGAIAAAIVLGTSASAVIAEPVYSYRSPFHPEQCEKAIGLAARALAAEAGNRRMRLTLAEGWLCRGLQGDAAAWRYAAGLPRGTALDLPALSDDGRYLSFGSVRSVLPYSFPALLDLETGALTDPVGGITDYPSFDAVISRDGSRIVISSQADLDPRVGNADHNMELFIYERATGQFTQIAETVGGIGLRSSGFCFPYRPRVNADARVVAFEFAVPPAFGGCYLQGPQRHELDGLAFGRVRAVRKRPGNQGPALSGRFSVWAVAGETLTLDFTATDPDGDPLTFLAQEVGVLELPPPGRPDVSPGSEIIDHRDGTATFRWPTTRRHLGAHTLRVAAFDEGGGEIFRDVRITVATAPCAGDCDADGSVTIDELVVG